MSYGKAKPWAYRCSNGLHTLITYGALGSGWPPKRMNCYFTMKVWRPERGRVEVTCTGVLLRQSARVRDYILAAEGVAV